MQKEIFIPGIFLALFEQEAQELEKLLVRIIVPLKNFLEGENCRKILRQRFNHLSGNLGWVWLNKDYLPRIQKGGGRNE